MRIGFEADFYIWSQSSALCHFNPFVSVSTIASPILMNFHALFDYFALLPIIVIGRPLDRNRM
ncbi:hypothetical protein D4L85_15830 [Chryseolinea soli]|uniref:Uncharacterized protein n=1 Tax=Chryseolinea soli TaxID=2321403 RepID=A0A385SLV5_9BACT|nr:hypothetical protein D4L85_15830 [Chryseolinea soli]